MADFFGTVSQSWFWKYFLSHFGWVDWMLAGFLFLGVILGLKNGMSRELPRLAETFLSLYLTMEYHGFFATWISRETPWPESYSRIFIFAVIWFLSWLVLRLFFEILGRLAHLEVAVPFQWVGGVLIAAARYFILCGMISYFLVLFPLDWIQRSYKVQSWSGQMLSQIPPKIHGWVNKVVGLRRSIPGD